MQLYSDVYIIIYLFHKVRGLRVWPSFVVVVAVVDCACLCVGGGGGSFFVCLVFVTLHVCVCVWGGGGNTQPVAGLFYI